MKNMAVLTVLLLGTTSAFAHIEEATVCSIGRNEEVYKTVFHAEDSQVAWDQDGDMLNFNIESVKGANLKRASAVCGEKVVQATDYVLSSPMGNRELQIAIGVSGVQYMVFPGVGVGASSDNCE